MTDSTENRRIGPFQLEGKLGVGGMGIVYKATYLKGGQKVAVKVLAPDLSADKQIAQRFEREMDILKKLKHPHIIKYYGGSTTGSQRFYAMELLSGGSLDELLRQQGRLSWEQALEYGIQIAKALEHAHNAGVIHRDLKPANLLIAKDGTLKLSDFGIARDTQSTALTAAGKTVGTMAYMAPEQITGKVPVTRRTDLYSLGCVLFQLVTGRTPFESDSPPELLFKHLEEEPPSTREFNMDVPIWLDRLILQMLEKDPEERPFDALAVQVMLEEVREKAHRRASVAAATGAGDAAVTRLAPDPELAEALGKKRKKKRKKKEVTYTPWYESLWFLGLCLSAVIGLIVWGLWPESEAAMYSRLKRQMASGDSTHVTGSEDDVVRFLERFPESAHASEAREWLDEIAVIRAQRRLANLEMRPNVSPDNEGERLYLDARRFENEGDRLTALSRYEAMQILLEDKPKLKPYVTLARRRVQEIYRSLDSEQDPINFVRSEIERADRLYREGKAVAARERWRAILQAYSGKPEFKVLLDQTQARLDNPRDALAAETP